MEDWKEIARQNNIPEVAIAYVDANYVENSLPKELKELIDGNCPIKSIRTLDKIDYDRFSDIER